MVVSLRATSALGRIFGWSSLFWKQENVCTYCGDNGHLSRDCGFRQNIYENDMQFGPYGPYDSHGFLNRGGYSHFRGRGRGSGGYF